MALGAYAGAKVFEKGGEEVKPAPGTLEEAIEAYRHEMEAARRDAAIRELAAILDGEQQQQYDH